MTRIFISYRRQDSQAITDRIYEYLSSSFGKKNIFKDVDNIPRGSDFRQVLQRAIKKSDVMLVIIGQQWGSDPRLHDPGDFVRQEVEMGLNNARMTVIPVMAGGAALPPAAQLPASLRPLVYRNAAQVRHDPDFQTDIGRLILDLGGKVKSPRAAPIAVPRPRMRPAKTGGRAARSGCLLTGLMRLAVRLLVLAALIFGAVIVAPDVLDVSPLDALSDWLSGASEKACDRWITYGGGVVVQIEEAESQPLWCFEGRQDEEISIMVETGGFRAGLTLGDPDNEAVASSEQIENEPLFMVGPLRLEESGTYSFMVASLDEGYTDYSVQLNRLSGAASDSERLPQADLPCTHFLDYERPFEVNVDLAMTRPFWCFEIERGQDFTVEFSAPDFEPYAELIAPSGEPIDAAHIISESERIFALGPIVADSPGVYGVFVDSQDGHFGDFWIVVLPPD